MNIKETVLEVLVATLPIVVLIALLQLFVVKLPAEVFYKFIGGSVLVMLGLILFLVGVKIGFLPIGEMIGARILANGNLWIILALSFVIGFVVTIAEPDLQVLASQVDTVSEGTISKNILLVSVALGVGIFLALGLLRFVLDIPITYFLLGGYALVFLLMLFTPSQFRAVAFDSGGVTTGPMTVPFVLSLGVGVASSARRRGAGSDTFGLVAMSSIGPILAVLLLGVIYG